MLRDAAKNWARANCQNPKLHSYIGRNLDDALRDRLNCWFAVGRGLTRRRVPYLLHCQSGEFFVFEMTDGQAAAYHLAPNALASSADQQPGLVPPADAPLSLSNFTLDGGDQLSARRPITGSCRYEVLGEAPTDYCLRLNSSLGLMGDLVGICSPGQLLERTGRLAFTFDPLARAESLFAQNYRGPVALFLRACALASASGETGSPISNACGMLVDLR